MAYDASPLRDQPVSVNVLDQVFTGARTRNGWSDRPVPESLIHQLYDLTKFGPTSLNMSTARFVFVTSPEARDRLVPLMSEGNRAKTAAAPVNVIIGYEVEFQDSLTELFPHAPGVAAMFNDDAGRREASFRNSTLQGGYMILAARALGLDAGPMSGFDPAGVKAAFFPDSTIEPNFVLSLGYGTDENLFPRSPRLAFDSAAKII
ncbi:malonic semialdehyde reductase [uncultured Brevundimonas sp.]|uniref:malonic semialdehyde reductase n=1 Tax=uncultured Brevundimonas sp. TaxID=213418 RepID=UPI0030EC85CE|tara:strand:- start:101 stop:715 length:615 start_codon:yes stop_codon:yes gene_type:complete